MAFNILSRMEYKLKQKGLTDAQASYIAYQTQLRQGNLIPGKYQLSEKGKAYSELHPNDRAKIRKEKNKKQFGFIPSF